MNSKIAVAVGLAAVLAAVLAPISTLTPAFAAEVEVKIPQGATNLGDKAFQPNPLNINVGDTVKWTNNDITTHTATSGTFGTDDTGNIFGGPHGQEFTTENQIAPGASKSFTFSEPGEYPYYCALHPPVGGGGMIGTIVVSAGPTPFSVTATAGGNEYEITGSGDATATAATINPNESVEIDFDGEGAVELTLPKTMIDDITTVNGEQATIVSETDTATTISFEVPEGETTVTIQGEFVVPEFPVIAAILAATIAGIIGYTRFVRSGTGFFGRA